ncbi:flagellar hook assembly protein FlgD [Rhodopila globiformis]|uniref:Basal-body rod modification protein FlgD n=1 Tax=Rhodopila globiformis TaxID=1071 RepID=A0A2S6MV13_RHOGL|nr:flagellar hook capping FlgD N-terminal domain-containing protein [Rhodopila globiformis]PPQ26207.1 flagellar biosynthesis protein FlgD [Rhodopila globiformis]
MSGSVTSSTGTTSSATSSSVAAQTSNVALDSLSSNFSDFLTLLMTQLQNQDPSSPMDTNQFTSELVQFSQVEQQINTNSNLTQLIQLTQASQVEQSAGMLGKAVTVNSSQLTLQNGSATINFNTTAAEPVAIGIYSAAGTEIQSATLTSSAGANTWTWDGKDASGNTMSDGAYTVSVNTVGTSGTTTAVPFTVTGTATAVQNNSGTVDLQMGGLTLPFSDVVSVGS